MRIQRSAISWVLLLVTTASMAADPPAPGAAAAPQAPVTAKAVQAPAAAAAAQAPIGPTMATARDAAALTVSAHELGYTKKLLNGKTVYYCKSDASIGTRLVSTKCYTEDQMSGVVQRSIANRESVAEMESKRMIQTNQPRGSSGN